MQKKIVLFALILTCLSFSLSHAVLSDIFPPARVYGKDTKIGVEVLNKNPKPVYAAVVQDNRLLRNTDGEELSTVKGIVKKFFEDKKDWKQYQVESLRKPTLIAFWTSNPGVIKYEKSGVGGLYGDYRFSPKPYKVYRFKGDGRTMYVSWDEKDYARPETGYLKGIMKETDSNLSLANNAEAPFEEVAA